MQNEISNETVNIDGRVWVVTGRVEAGPASAEHMTRNGLVPAVFMVEGQRGAIWMAHKSAASGLYSLTTNLRR